MPDEAAPPTPVDRRRARAIRPLALGLIGALTGILGYALVVDPSTSTEEAAGNRGRRAPPPLSTPPARAAEVYETILPSLVFIRARAPGSASIGSGVVVAADGQILTAHHVVRDATTVQVTFADGTESEAEVVSADPSHDIAVLQTDLVPERVVPAVLGSVDAVRVGDHAFTAGNPLGLAGSLAAGVISGLDRTIPLENGLGDLDGLIQFDAAVNRGSSGGPLLNRDGQVIGIVTALANPTEQSFFVGIGFAVPITTAASAAGGPDQ